MAQQQLYNLKKTRDFIAIYEICFTLSSPISDRCIKLKEDSALFQLLRQRFPYSGQHFSQQPMLWGRLFQLFLMCLWRNAHGVAKISSEEKYANSLTHCSRMMDPVGYNYGRQKLLNFHHDPKMAQALGGMSQRVSIGELLARLTSFTVDEVHQPPLYPGMGPIQATEVLTGISGHAPAAQASGDAGGEMSSPFLQIIHHLSRVAV